MDTEFTINEDVLTDTTNLGNDEAADMNIEAFMAQMEMMNTQSTMNSQIGWSTQMSSLGMVDPMTAQLFGMLWGGIFVVFGLLLLVIVSWCMLFRKMGNAWYEALISWHNTFVLVTKAWKPGRWVFAWVLAPLFFLVPVIGWIVWGVLLFVVWLLTNIWLAKKFNKSPWFGVWLTFLPFVFYPILAFSKAQYQEESPLIKEITDFLHEALDK
jgi:hypothetical protein